MSLPSLLAALRTRTVKHDILVRVKVQLRLYLYYLQVTNELCATFELDAASPEWSILTLERQRHQSEFIRAAVRKRRGSSLTADNVESNSSPTSERQVLKTQLIQRLRELMARAKAPTAPAGYASSTGTGRLARFRHTATAGRDSGNSGDAVRSSIM